MNVYNSQNLNTLYVYSKDPLSPKNSFEKRGTAGRCATLFPGLSKHQGVFTIVNISWMELDDIPDQGGDWYGLSSTKVSFSSDKIYLVIFMLCPQYSSALG